MDDKDLKQEQGLDLGVALFLLKTSGPKSVLEYMIRTIMEIWGLKVTPNGVTEFGKWTVSYAQKRVKEELDLDLSDEDTIKNLIVLSLQDMEAFLETMREGILSGAGKVAGYSEQEIRALLAVTKKRD